MQKFMKSWSLNKLRSLYDVGLLVLPRTQRDFIWTATQESSLVESALTDKAYIPSLTVVACDNGYHIIFYLVDGQQRVTSLINWFNNNLRLRLPQNRQLCGETFTSLSQNNMKIQQYDGTQKALNDILNDEDKLPVTVITLGSHDDFERVLTAQVRTLNTDARAFCRELQIVLSESYPSALRDYILDNKGRRITPSMTSQTMDTNLMFDKSMYKSANSESLRIQLLEAAVIGVQIYAVSELPIRYAVKGNRDSLRSIYCSDDSCVSSSNKMLILKGFRRAKFLLNCLKDVTMKDRIAFYKAVPILASFSSWDPSNTNVRIIEEIANTIRTLGRWDRQRRAGKMGRECRETGFYGEYCLFWDAVGMSIAKILNISIHGFYKVEPRVIKKALVKQHNKSFYNKAGGMIDLMTYDMPYFVIKTDDGLRVFSPRCISDE